ncbi:MAG TPA: hypothetical protein GXZ48_03075 [Acholeplasmataceae bacterium]|nr:hypothetical protein [Acholeplasmataceae bacterium]
MRRRVTLSFLIWTFTISYIMWGTIIISNQFSYLEFGSPISMILFIIGGNAPAIVAYFILKKERRVDSFGQFVKRAFAIKQKLLYYFCF